MSLLRFDSTEPGLPLSAAGHVLLFVAGLIGFAGQPPKFDEHREAVPVEFVTEAQLRELTQGDLKAKEVLPNTPPHAEVKSGIRTENDPGQAKRDIPSPAEPKPREETRKVEPPPLPPIIGRVEPPKPAPPPKPPEPPRAAAVPTPAPRAQAKSAPKPAPADDDEDEAEDGEVTRQTKVKTPEEKKPDRLAVLIEEQKKAEESKRLEEQRRRDEARKAEEIKKLDEAHRIEEQRRREDTQRIEQARKSAEDKRREEQREAEAERKAEEAKKLADAKRAEEVKKREDARRAEAVKNAEEDRKRREAAASQPAMDADAIRKKLLASREAPASAGASAPQTNPRASAGAPAASGAKLSPSDREALVSMLRDQMLRCWSVNVTVAPAVKPMIRMQLNADGSIAGTPALLNSSGDPNFRPVAESGIRALRQCGPYKIPSRFAPFHSDWKTLNVQLDPSDVI